MTIKEVPRSFIYICDCCTKQHKQEDAGGHYTDSRPPHWGRLKLAQTAYDWQGAAYADASIERLLCDTCLPKVAEEINKATEREPRTAAGSLD